MVYVCFYDHIFKKFIIKKIRECAKPWTLISTFEYIKKSSPFFFRKNKVHSVSSRGSVVKRVFINKKTNKQTINAISMYMYDQYIPNLKKKILEHYRTRIFTILIEAPLHIKTVLLCLFDAEE